MQWHTFNVKVSQSQILCSLCQRKVSEVKDTFEFWGNINKWQQVTILHKNQCSLMQCLSVKKSWMCVCVCVCECVSLCMRVFVLLPVPDFIAKHRHGLCCSSKIFFFHWGTCLFFSLLPRLSHQHVWLWMCHIITFPSLMFSIWTMAFYYIACLGLHSLQGGKKEKATYSINSVWIQETWRKESK